MRRTRHEQRSTGRLERDDDERHTRDDAQGRRGAGRHRSAGSRSRGHVPVDAKRCRSRRTRCRHAVSRGRAAVSCVRPLATSNAPLPDVIVPLSQDAVERAGIVVAPVTSGTSATELRLPGVVEPNAYRQVVVTPLVAGRVTKVGPALGDRVRRGQTLAEIYSPALAEAQTRYVSAQAMLDAHDRELQRTQKLVEIGAASRQELEKIHAEHAAQTAAVQSARSQLELLGVSASALENMAPGHNVSATTTVPAPIDGVVTERGANVGLNVDTATKLFTVVDLSTVWVVADLYEKDFSRVRVGSEAAITTSARPDADAARPRQLHRSAGQRRHTNREGAD